MGHCRYISQEILHNSRLIKFHKFDTLLGHIGRPKNSLSLEPLKVINNHSLILGPDSSQNTLVQQHTTLLKGDVTACHISLHSTLDSSSNESFIHHNPAVQTAHSSFTITDTLMVLLVTSSDAQYAAFVQEPITSYAESRASLYLDVNIETPSLSIKYQFDTS